MSDPDDYTVNLARQRAPWWTADLEAGYERSLGALQPHVRMAIQWLILLDQEVEGLRRDVEDTRSPYKGTWRSGGDYVAGAFVTHAGTLWHCNVTGTPDKPGTSDAWTLMVKSR
jgi:hypothetical protein